MSCALSIKLLRSQLEDLRIRHRIQNQSSTQVLIANLKRRNNEFNNPAGLVEFINAHVGTIKIRSDHKLIFMRKWEDAATRLVGVQYLIKELCKIAA